MRASIALLIFAVLSGCASTPEPYSAAYEHGGSALPSESGYQISPTQTVVPPYPNPVTQTDTASDAVYAIVDAATSLALHPDFYKRSAIAGSTRCLGAGKNDIEIPCGIVDVVLMSDDGKELARTQTDQQKFAFTVKQNVAYRLQIHSRTYRMDPPQTKRVLLGDEITLQLIAI